MPKKIRKTLGSNEYLSGSRATSLFRFLMENDLNVNKVKIKNLLWGSYKPYSYIDSKTVLSWNKILEVNPDYKKKEMNRRVDFHFIYE